MWEQVKTRADQHIEQILADQEKKVKFFFIILVAGKGRRACRRMRTSLLKYHCQELWFWYAAN